MKKIIKQITGQHGVTLVELVVSIVIIAVALGGVMMVMNYTLSHSADPVLRQQAIAIAEAYIEEITLKYYTDPDADGEASRSLYDDVDDYNGMSHTGAQDQTGTAITGLENYAVSVTVASQTFGSPAVSGLRIDVTVTDPAGEALTLSGYRATY